MRYACIATCSALLIRSLHAPSPARRLVGQQSLAVLAAIATRSLEGLQLVRSSLL